MIAVVVVFVVLMPAAWLGWLAGLAVTPGPDVHDLGAGVNRRLGLRAWELALLAAAALWAFGPLLLLGWMPPPIPAR